LTQHKNHDGGSAHLAWRPTRWETIIGTTRINAIRESWNNGDIFGQKAPFKRWAIWALRVRFQIEPRLRELAVSNLVLTVRNDRGMTVEAFPCSDWNVVVQRAGRTWVVHGGLWSLSLAEVRRMGQREARG